MYATGDYGVVAHRCYICQATAANYDAPLILRSRHDEEDHDDGDEAGAGAGANSAETVLHSRPKQFP